MYQQAFLLNDNSIHELAVAKLMYGSRSEILLMQEPYSYRVSGGNAGSLFYRKGAENRWVQIASWNFYGAYILVRYRHTLWLRPMYNILFAYMNYPTVEFCQYSIVLEDPAGNTVFGKNLRLVPPGAMQAVMAARFGYSPDELQKLKTKFPTIFYS